MLTWTACSSRKSPRYQGYALIANQDGPSIAVVDLSRFQFLKKLGLSAAPSWVIAPPSGRRAFILGSAAPFMDVLNLDTLQLEKRLALPGIPQAVVPSPSGRSLWIALHQPDILLEWRIDLGRRGSQLPLPGRGSHLDLISDTAGDHVVVSLPDIHKVAHYSATSGLLLSPRLDHSPAPISLRADGKVILLGNSDARSITVLDAATLHPIADLPLAVYPRHFCLNRDRGQLFVSGPGMDAVAIVSPFQTEVGETILAGSAPGVMAATMSGPQYLFVSNPDSGDVTILDIDTRKVLAQVPVGQRPGAILLTPDNEYALILNEQSGDMAVIRLLMIRQANAAARRNRTAALFTLVAVGSRPVSGAIAPKIL